ncbi:hypothetical protein [Arthrobacter sp. QXT-31]|uniref:hypothetical protein n=1 Tax=Arthrobacter sp. QXT-31 TaxID=1357915 RepID=UPI0012F7A79F|nr:hypothetical protein [Arthrobacter sp. QXT-31]
MAHPVFEELGDGVQVEGRVVGGVDEFAQVVGLEVGFGVVVGEAAWRSSQCRMSVSRSVMEGRSMTPVMTSRANQAWASNMLKV